MAKKDIDKKPTATKTEEDAKALADAIVGDGQGDALWTRAERGLATALLLVFHDPSALSSALLKEASQVGGAGTTTLDEMFGELAAKDPKAPEVLAYNAYAAASRETRRAVATNLCILVPEE